MSDKSLICNACGRWHPTTRLIDLDDGDGLMPTCEPCVLRLSDPYIELADANPERRNNGTQIYRR